MNIDSSDPRIMKDNLTIVHFYIEHFDWSLFLVHSLHQAFLDTTLAGTVTILAKPLYRKLNADCGPLKATLKFR